MTDKEETRIEPTPEPDPYDDEPEEDFEEEEAPRKRGGRVLPIVVASLAIVGFVVIVYYAYQQGIRAGSEQNPPVIRADEGPAKVRPAQPGGMEVPNQNMKVYELGRPGSQAASGGPERILPKPEEPLQRPAAPAPAAAPSLPVTPAPAGATQQADAGASAQVSGAQVAGAVPGAVVTPPPPPLPGSGQTMAAPAPSMSDVQSVLTPPARPSGPAVPAPPPPPTPPRGLVPGNFPVAGAIPPPPSAASAATSRAPAATTQAAAAPRQQTAAVPSPSGTPRVQLVAGASQDAADKTAKALAVKFPDLLGAYTYEIEPITDNRGTFYRVLFGPLGTRAEAMKLCDELKARKQDCLVR